MAKVVKKTAAKAKTGKTGKTGKTASSKSASAKPKSVVVVAAAKKVAKTAARPAKYEQSGAPWWKRLPLPD